ncbi:hypothetical protein LR48_Vigan252s001300 [Vigna angularis]|uniref:Uncharacterized protein n=1 Tax=Phaseolus angularis TaxID=3914 RepID=A0A0L9T7F7_PHAAN|nr:hypothetical protein LR48_Vigan252s001300 [Vigna angularis]
MTGEGSERRDKGKGVARLKKRQRQAPKYVLRVSATLPTTIAPSPSSVGPSPTPTVHPPPTPAVHPPLTPTADILPPAVIIIPTTPPYSDGDGDGVDPPLHDQPWIDPYGKGNLWAFKRVVVTSLKLENEKLMAHKLAIGGEAGLHTPCGPHAVAADSLGLEEKVQLNFTIHTDRTRCSKASAGKKEHAVSKEPRKASHSNPSFKESSATHWR